MHIKLLLISCLLLTVSCKKEKKIDEVTYEVILLNATSWDGGYLNENAVVVGVDNGPTNWKYTFKNVNHLIAAQLNAYPIGSSGTPDAILRIYVNGVKVAENKASVFPQVLYTF